MSNGEPVSKVESMNSGVRSFAAVALIFTTCAAFVYGTITGKPSVSTDAFMGLVGVVVTWLFKSSDEKVRQDAAVAAAKELPK